MFTAMSVQVSTKIEHFSHVNGPSESKTSESSAAPFVPPSTPMEKVSDETAARNAPELGIFMRRRENSTVRTVYCCKRTGDDFDQAHIRDCPAHVQSDGVQAALPNNRPANESAPNFKLLSDPTGAWHGATQRAYP